MAKKEQKQLILWAVVALVLGVLIGVLMTNAVTGNARSVLSAEEDSKQEENITEERIDLTLDTLNVNNIRNRENSPLNIGSTSSIITQAPTISIGAWNDGNGSIDLQSNFITLHAGESDIYMEPELNYISGQNISIKAQNLFKIFGSTQPTQPIIEIDGDDRELTITTSTRFTNLSDGPTGTAQDYELGDQFVIENYTIEVMNIWDANNAVQLKLRTDTNGTIATEVYGEGEIIFNDYLSINLIVQNIYPGGVSIGLPPSGVSYACFDQYGNLFKSQTPCN